MSLNFSNLLSPDSVHTNVAAGSKKHALQILSEHLASAASDATADDIFDALIERERLGCTAAESGLAIPHAKLPGIKEATAVLMQLETPIDFDGNELPAVDLIFGFITPDDSSEELADDLRRLTQTIATPALAEQMRASTEAADIYAVLDRTAAHQVLDIHNVAGGNG